MSSGLNPALRALTAGNPAQFLSQASAIAELDRSSAEKVAALSAEEEQAQRARETADQQIAQANALETR